MSMGMGSFASRVVATAVVATDGTGDFTTIQEAIDSLPAGGGVVYIKEGTYDSGSSGFSITSNNVGLFGAGASTIIKATGATAMLTIDGYDNITLKNIMFNGTGMASGQGIYLLDCNSLIITGCYITNAPSNGLFIAFTTKSSISDNYIYSNGLEGIQIVASDFSIGGKTGPVTDVIITGNFIYSNSGRGIKLTGDVTNKVAGVIIMNNRVRDNNADEIWIKDVNVLITIVVGNNLNGTATDSLDDSGTGTIAANNATD